jgi:DNA-binding transcriptional ArsR family regulator
MAFERPRELTDPRAMRALAHPVRLALLEAFADTETLTLTATEAGERVGESPANASFHLRQLAKYGFVEEAERGTGRRRPWKLKHKGMHFSDVHDDPETAGAARALSRTMRTRYLARAQRAFEEGHALPKEWRAATGVNQMGMYLTPEELKTLNEEIVALLFERFGDRRTKTADLPEGAEHVEILAMSYRL